MKRNHEASLQSPEALLKDLKALVVEAEKMVADSVEDSVFVANIGARFEAAQQRFGEAYTEAKKKVAAGAKCTDQAIRSNPYQSLAAALGVGVLLGVIVARQK